ncbi:hypothetical protein [Pseudoxanthomonas suwonensis]|uniref:hypothetical protein n=1 Tax=Pseudoxanthomonas suwonensis TaxID=314722 RepID=UPI000AFB992E|nr:hypothetical protein [Pseudoxanthomonas suwonensis]
MTRLQIVLSRISREDESGAYLPLLADETVASWARRQPGVCLHSESLEKDTFGQLIIDLPELPRTLQEQLQRAAQPPDDWLLLPHQRTLQCPRCLAEDWAQGVPAYNRRAWCVAWRTCCPRHGPLFDTDNHKTPPRWMRLLESPRWTGQELCIRRHRPNGVLLRFSLGADRRAIHLETALAGRQHGAWFPKGMTQTTLRAIYRELVSDLLDQVYLAHDGPEDQHPNPGFNRAKNGNRFAINVLAEAILSEWTATPLPTSALALRTPLLVRAIGWGEDRPLRVRTGQVLLHGPTERTHSLAHYDALLRKEDYARLAKPTDDECVGYLTLPEARLLGLSCSETITVLTRMTAQGRFLAFDARRGCLVENRSLPQQAHLTPEQVPTSVMLPAWAFRPPPSLGMNAVSDELRDLLGAKSPDSKLRDAARQRRRHRNERNNVRFSPARRGDEATSDD